ncbi:MAG TPA: tetratricopeptide repeat protein [Nitrosopumilaceae archaeon]|nr:tetratricopeptide repeat protein [Nitrosopumilaceae archaeon]
MAEPTEHWNLKAEELKKAGKFEEAIKMLDKVQEVKREEKGDDFWYKKAIHYCEIAEYEKAKEALEKDLEKNHNSYYSFLLMGKIFYQLKKYAESLEFYNKALEEYSSQHLRNVNKIDQMKNVKKFEEAIKYSDKVYQEKEIDDEFWYQKGMVLNKLKKFTDASSCFKTILENDQNNPKILYELAKSYLWEGNKQESLQILEQACKLDSDIKEKLRVDHDFEPISDERQFQTIVGLLQ